MNVSQLLTKLKTLIYSKSETDTLLGNKAASSHTHSDYIPKSGGAVITANSIGRENNTGNLDVCGGTSFENGAFIALRAKDTDIPDQKGVAIVGTNDGSASCALTLFPNGTMTWGSSRVNTDSYSSLNGYRIYVG